MMMRCFYLFSLWFCLAVSARENEVTWPAGDDLAIDLLATQPQVEQPIFLNFDHRGRMWVAQFRQYPFPAGAKLIGRDRFWRNEYDRVIPPPGDPEYVPGKDRITIHEDTTGDGLFDKISTFLDGLNFCTSFAHDRDGLWVLQPPYLLFYEDKDHDDQPDGPPQVHLRGFGIEDSHSLANSLCRGPDGWLYGANGSTTSLRITVEGKPDPPVVREGQLVWRYHPLRKTFEIFAEGGGNNLSCEFDSVGRLYSGSNTGDVAFYYHQGAYYQKNFGKHGALSNPHTYGYLPGIAHQKYSRVTNSVIIYEGGGLPSRFDGAMVFANPLTLGIGSYRPTLDGLNFKVTPNGIVDVRKNDPWFCPVYVDSGPDGALYVCDWYDRQCNHYRNSEGKISVNDGRLFRIRDRRSSPQKSFNLDKASVPELLDHLKSSNRWWRESARQALRDHKSREDALPTFQTWISREKGQLALEGLWGWHSIEDLSLPAFREALASENPHVRRWAIRLASDHRSLSPSLLQAIQTLVRTEPDLEVLAQIASSAARLPKPEAFPLLSVLMQRDEVSKDPRLALLTWWAIEAHFNEFPRDCLALFDDEGIHAPRVLSFLMRRFVEDGDPKNLHLGSLLFRRTRNFDQKSREHLWEQFDAGLAGQPLATLPEPMLKMLAIQGDLPLFLKLGMPIRFPKARTQAMALLKMGEKGSQKALLRVIEYFGENPTPEATPLLLELLASKNFQVLEQTLGSLQSIDSEDVGKAVLARFKTFPAQPGKAAEVLLLSRVTWISQWLDEAARDNDFKKLLTSEVRRKIAAQNHPGNLQKLAKLFPEPAIANQSFEKEIIRLDTLLKKNLKPDVENGYKLFSTRCAACHVLHAQGGQIGPALTSYQREDLDTLLLAIVHPNAEIREGFATNILKTRDGRTLTGFLKAKNKRHFILQPAGGKPLAIAADQVISLEPAKASLMPAGLLTGLTDQQLTDFFAYLRSPQPINLRQK